ncbi:MAG: hypothetical protein PHP62_03865 [Candidatus Moranbacteria bacterium]|nr:hypothetical protein [Candidatus Moranbacteria bacterium]
MQMDPELLAQRKKLQMAIMLKDSDIKRSERAMLDVDVVLRELKHKQSQLQTETLLKENQLKKLTADHQQMQLEIIKLKHQMNNLGR